MFNLSGSELIFLVVIALVVLGPDKLPEAMRKAGKAYADFKKMTTGFQSEMKSVLDEPMRELRETAEMAKKSAMFDVNGTTTEKPVSASMADQTPAIIKPAAVKPAVKQPTGWPKHPMDIAKPPTDETTPATDAIDAATHAPVAASDAAEATTPQPGDATPVDATSTDPRLADRLPVESVESAARVESLESAQDADSADEVPA